MITSLSEKINEYRKGLSLTQEQLGAALGISGQAVSKWERGESLPDIMLLPQLCQIFFISSDDLLKVPCSVDNKSSNQLLCTYTNQKGSQTALLEAFSHLLTDSGIKFGPDHLIVYDRVGMGFVMENEKCMKNCFNTDTEKITYILRILTDDGCLSVLRCISMDKAVTKDDISKITKLDEAVVDKILLGFMKRKIITCDTDNVGKSGYLQGSAMSGVLMILAGCYTLGQDGAILGQLWFTRNKK